MRASQPGPEGRADPAGWRRWLLPAGVTAVLFTLLALPPGTAPGTVLTYSRFVSDVGAGAVKAVTIDPAGQVAGTLATGQPFTTTIPAALGDRTLAGRLAAHHVQITATAATPHSPLSALIGVLPLLLLGGFILFAVRSARRQAATLGGLGGAGSVTRAKTRVIGAERPATRFADVAGYPAVKTEIREVVDYLRDPGRYQAAEPAGRGACSWPGRRAPARPCSPARSPARPASRSCR